MSDTRRIGYGFNRTARAFEAAGVDDAFIDTDRTGRGERQLMFRVGLRRGDTLVLLALGDLGAGKGLRNLRAELEAKGVTVEVHKPAPAEPKPMGRPSAAGLDDETWERLRVMWTDPATDGAYLLTQGCKAMGLNPTKQADRDKARYRMYRRFKVKRGQG